MVIVHDEKDAKKNSATLTPATQSLMRDATRRQSMSTAARNLGHPDAASAVAGILRDLAEPPGS